MSDDLAFTPALELAARVRAREVSPVELAELYLERIERLDPQLNAYVTVDAEGALAAARAAESAPSDAPFHGVPTSIKDLNETAGLRTTYSTKAYAANVPAFDAAVVRRIREAGFVVLGKTNTPEFGTIAMTESELNGICRNPWDVSRTPGGSSGGAAAATAAARSASRRRAVGYSASSRHAAASRRRRTGRARSVSVLRDRSREPCAMQRRCST